jgi:hypothetical protein
MSSHCPTQNRFALLLEMLEPRKERAMVDVANDTHVLANELSLRLRDFHRALIRAEAGHDPDLQNPYTFLFAVIGDPRFAWTNTLTQLIVKLDEKIAEGEIATPEDLEPFRTEASRLIGGEKTSDPKFRLRHLMAIQQVPDVALATGALRKAISKVPTAKLAA